MRKNGIYVSGTDVIENTILGFQDTLVNRQMDEVTAYIRRHSVDCETEVAPARYIAFNNGIVDIEADTLQLQDFTPDIVLTHKLNVDFVNPATVPDNEDNIAFVEKVYNDWTNEDKELITLLDELTAYCGYRGCDFHSFYLFSGLGGNGKSTYFKIVKAIVDSACMSMNLKELTTDKFAPVNLHNMTCNISADEMNLNILDTGNFKRLTGGDNVTVDKKYAPDRITFNPVTTFLISMNEDLTFNDTTKGFSRRVKVIPFNNEFIGANRDADIERRLLSKEVLQIIAYRAIVAFKKRLDGGYNDLTLPSSVDVATKKYLAENNPIGEFAKWYMENHYHSTCMLATEFYDTFKKWCVSNCLSGLNITDNLFRKGIRNYKFTFDIGSQSGTEDVCVYTPDYVADNDNLNPNIKFYDCSNCAYCGMGTECLHCIKKDLFDTKDTTLNVPELLEMFYNELPDDVKDKLSVSKSGFILEGLED